MHRARAIALILITVGASLAAVAPGGVSSLVLRGPIVITSDAGFSAANGVVAGTGTPADPFVISGWHVKATSGAAIRIEGVTASFLVTGNLVESSGGGSIGVQLMETQGDARIESNQILYSGIGVRLTRSDATVAANQLLAKASGAYGVYADASAAEIRANMIDGGAVGVWVLKWRAEVEANTITASTVGVRVDDAWWTEVRDNVVDRVPTGVVAGAGAVNVTANTFVQGRTSVSASGTAFLNFSSNEIDGAQADAVLATRTTVAMYGNVVISALGRGIVLTDATGVVAANNVSHTEGAIVLAGASVVRVQGNAMWSNEFGLSIPYAARASIPHLSGNTVNGFSTANVYHWQAANVAYADATFESGFSTGLYGGLSAEGALVFYDVNTATLTNVTILHQARGVTAVNSFNVQVEGSLLLNARCGVVFEGTIGFVKNSTIVIPVDPPGTCGVDVKGGLVGVLNNTIVNFDVGVKLDAHAKGNVTLNTVTGSAIGIQVEGKASQTTDAVAVFQNNVTANGKGIVLVAFRGTIRGNNVTFNAGAGIELRLQSAAFLVGNRVVGNFEGIVDVYSCVTIAYQTCSSAFLLQNNVSANANVGVRLNGTATLTGNVLSNNTVGADLRGGATLTANVVRNNSQEGVIVRGTATVEGDVYAGNRVGLALEGIVFHVLHAEFSANFHGIVLVELPPNVPLPPIGIPGVPTLPPLAPPSLERDPLFVHFSRFELNRGDAIHATPYTFVNATYNWWGSANGPPVNVQDQAGVSPSAFLPARPRPYENGVTAGAIVFLPWFADRQFSDTAPVPGL